MTAPRDPDHLIHAFLLDGEEMLHDQVYDEVRAAIEHKRQRAFIGPWRTPIMNRSVVFSLGAAAVVVIGLLLGYRLLGSPENLGGSGGPTPTPEATATPEPTPEPSATGPIEVDSVPQGTRLGDGDYVFTHLRGVQVVFTASSSWERNIPNWVVWTIDDNKATMSVSTVDNVVIDPCQPDLGLQDPAVGPTVDELVTALRAVPGLTFSAPTDVTQDGHSGVRLDYVPPDDFDNCLDDMGEAILMSVEGSVPADHGYIPAPNGDDALSVFIYDVDGTRVVIAAAYTENRRDELDEMLASIRFEQP
jgi:hypothetical protein